MPSWQLHSTRCIDIHATESQDHFVRIEQSRMDSLKVLQHEHPALVGIPPEVILAVKRMRKAVAFIAGSREKRIQRIDCV